MTPTELEQLIRESLDKFYQRRLDTLTKLKLKDILKKKNPYLFRAVGIRKASEIVTAILQAYMSSSDETIFGAVFFEPIVLRCSGGIAAKLEGKNIGGIDIIIETDTTYKAIQVKSGPNIFNASQTKRMNDEFKQLRDSLLNLNKQFDPLLAHCYGYKTAEPKNGQIYRVRAGQTLWEELTGDPDFYLKIIRLMQDYPNQHRASFEQEWDKALNRFEFEFLRDFGTLDGSIDWEKLLRFNSGVENTKKPSIRRAISSKIVKER